MKVAEVINSNMAFEYYNNRLRDAETEMMERTMLDNVFSKDDYGVKCQQKKIDRYERDLIKLLNTDTSEVPLMHPLLNINKKDKGNKLDILS